MHTSYHFTNAIARQPGASVTQGLREGAGADPDATVFRAQHFAYLKCLQQAGVKIHLLEPLEAYPDSVFIEDAALCVGNVAIVLKPGAPSRIGESKALKPVLEQWFDQVIELPGKGSVDGGDVLLAESEVFIGLSARTNKVGLDALTSIMSDLGFVIRRVNTPSSLLHLKTGCGLLDASTIFASADLAATGCFEGYRIIETLPSEPAAANLIRVNNHVLLSAGHPKTHDLLQSHAYQVIEVECSEAAKLNGGLSCMSLRYHSQKLSA